MQIIFILASVKVRNYFSIYITVGRSKTKQIIQLPIIWLLIGILKIPEKKQTNEKRFPFLNRFLQTMISSRVTCMSYAE